jgi:hypothetical protein
MGTAQDDGVHFAGLGAKSTHGTQVHLAARFNLPRVVMVDGIGKPVTGLQHKRGLAVE